jgi:hypothetical protein
MPKTLNKLTIGSIFEKDEQGNYTSGAQLCQYILRYYHTKNNTILSNEPFTLRDLQDWIVLNNPEIRKDYEGFAAHTPIKSRRHTHSSQIDGRFRDLIQLRLIGKSMRAKLYSTGSLHAEKVLYEYTREGIFLALIIKSMDLKGVVNTTRTKDKATQDIKNLENVYRDIYDCLVNSVFKVNENSLAANIFYSNLIKKCKDKDVFDKFVGCMHYVINNRNNDITSIPELFALTVDFAFPNKEKSEYTFTNILIETIRELEQKDQKLILNRLKMHAEEDYENSQDDWTREYEEFRFESINDYAHVAIQGYCKNCKTKRNVKLHYLDLRRISISDNKRIDCPACKSKNCVTIPKLYY